MPRLYSVEAPTAAAIPASSSTMAGYAHHSLVVGAAGAALALGGHMAPALAGAWSAARGPMGVEDRTAGETGVALTFDDGPHRMGTPAVLEILAAAGAKATFFMVGEQARRCPGLVGEVADCGHEVALHCDRHHNLLRRTPGQTRQDINRARATIEDRIGRKVTLYRPPYGILNRTALLTAKRGGMRTMLWTHWGRDWERGATGQSIAALVTRGLHQGAVLLLHDSDAYSASGSWRATADALPAVLRAIGRLELEVVDL